MNKPLRKVLVATAVCLYVVLPFALCEASAQTLPASGPNAYDVSRATAGSTISMMEFSDPDASGRNFNYDNYGYSAAVSGDGSTALIGAFSALLNDVPVGKAYAYDNVNGQWSSTPSVVFANPSSTGNGGFSSVVSLSSDGNEALITAPTDVLSTSSNNSRVYIYKRSGGVWSTEPSATIENPDAKDHDCFGCSAALSADGTTVLIGAFGASVNGEASAGMVYLYRQTNGVWSTTPVATFSPPTVTAYYEYGFSVALSADGAMALVGSAPESKNPGAAYAYETSNGVWPSAPSPAATFDDPRNLNYDTFGGSVALSAYGGTALIGEWLPLNGSWVVYVFDAADGIWSTTPAAEFDDPANSEGDYLRSAVALSGDGNTALIEGEHELSRSSGPNCCGVAYVYTKTNGLWGLRATATLREADAKDSAYNVDFGSSLALSSDGTIALIGDPQPPNPTPPPPSTVPQYGGPGTAYAFETSGSWKQSGSGGGGKSGGGALGGWALLVLLVLLVIRRRGTRLS